MSTTEYLIDTNILIYHTEGSEVVSNIIREALARKAFNVSVLTKIEFLGWEKHSPEGFEKCSRLIKPSNVYLIDDDIAEKTIELKRRVKIKLADAVIAATALVNNFKLVTRNVDAYKAVKELEMFNPFE
jgi:predicted nucleic acid-binding protein